MFTKNQSILPLPIKAVRPKSATTARSPETEAALDNVLRKLQSQNCTLRVVYEAGPCGYAIYRRLSAKKIDCTVIAPSQTPKKSGDRVKTDRRDAISLARLHRAGERDRCLCAKRRRRSNARPFSSQRRR